MAGTSPRRSIRAARTTQPNSGSHHSSASSNSSGRADRNTRTSQKIESSRKSTPSGSLSSEPLEDTVALTIEDNLSTRRRKRGQPDDQSKSSKSETIEIANGIDELVEDDEAVRCICGNEEYPGPPPLSEEDSKKGIKDSSEIELPITEADYTEDLAGFFVQCDTCKVWQHGLCVGIKSEEQSPDEYFCELCRKDLHRIFTASNGQKYSHYLPLYQPLSRTSSRAASFSKDGTRSPKGSKSGRPSSSLQSAKRRSTMNSRDAAYDEEEELRRAIEASKGQPVESTDGGTTRRGKRGRSESEDKHEMSKRQRTLSGSPSPSNDLARFASVIDSDDGTNGRSGGVKKIRGAAARNHKEKEAREERERSRAQAANKRANRAERRRIDDSDPSEETPPARSSAKGSSELAAQLPDPPASSLPPDTPPAEKAQPSTSHKKGGRPPQGRKGKLGKNQYTRDKEDGDDQSPGRSQSRDVARGDENGHATTRASNHDNKHTKSKASGGSKITMLDMKKKVAAMLDFISRTQLEMAGDTTPTSGDSTEKMMRNLAGSILPLLQASVGGSGKESSGGGAAADEDKESRKDFKDLSLLEMMDELTRQLVKWQNQFI